MKLTQLEMGELALVVSVVAAVVIWGPTPGWELPFGPLVGYCAALLLGQSLLRDVVRIALERGRAKEGRRRIGCLCAESSIGLLFVVLAVGLSLIGITQSVTLARGPLAGLVAAILLGGFFAKDFVVIVRREKDHGSIVVW